MLSRSESTPPPLPHPDPPSMLNMQLVLLSLLGLTDLWYFLPLQAILGSGL